MGNWEAVTKSIRETPSSYDQVRKSAIDDLSAATGRNTIVYYSAWLQKNSDGLPFTLFEVDDSDMNALMAVVSGLPKDRGLDLVLHTPGGDIAAAEAIGDYLCSVFSDIRVIVPQLALSAGTMLACIGSTIVMGKHSSLGAFDPLIGAQSARTICTDFWNAVAAVKADEGEAVAWSTLIFNYAPYVSEAQRAIEWSEEIVTNWLAAKMFLGRPDPLAEARAVVEKFTSQTETKAHRRHIGPRKAQAWGLKIELLESNHEVQDLVLTAHHACIATLTDTDAYKLIQSNMGAPVISHLQQGG